MIELKLFWTIYFLLLGIIFGGFYMVVVVRGFSKESLFVSSHCTKCGHKLKFIEATPIFGYIISKGKCKYCGDKISIFYTLGELLTGIVFGIVFLKYEFSFYTFFAFFMYSLLIILSFYDIKYMILPFKYIFLGIFAILICRCIVFYLTKDFGVIEFTIKSFVFSYLILLPFIIIGVFGGGDGFLMGLIGIWFGYKQAIVIFLLSIVLAGSFYLIRILMRKKNNKFSSFGEFICLSAFLIDIFEIKNLLLLCIF